MRFFCKEYTGEYADKLAERYLDDISSDIHVVRSESRLLAWTLQNVSFLNEVMRVSGLKNLIFLNKYVFPS